jgi:hypothetical protein
MPVWGWIVIVIAVVVVLAAVVWQVTERTRSTRLRDRFGPEYDRAVAASGDKGSAEAELAERERERERLEIRPLSETSRVGYLESWRTLQAEFVDDPARAVADADELLQRVMAERGYPVEDFDERATLLSVDHPRVVQNYREGHRLAEMSRGDGATTEDLRQSMHHYRELFDELVGSPESRAA